MAQVEAEGRATSDQESRRHVRGRIEQEGVEFVLLWFTDIEGHLKSFAVTPSEIADALDDGMGFDGSSITGSTRSRSRTWSRSPTRTPSS